MRRLVLATTLLLLMATAEPTLAPGARADSGFNPNLESIYLSFDPTSRPDKGLEGRYKNAEPLEPFTFYLMLYLDWGIAPFDDPARNDYDGASAWEARVVLPPEVVVSSRELPAGHTNFGGSADNWIVGTGSQCITGDQTPFVLVTYTALLASPATDRRIQIKGSIPSAFDEDPGCVYCVPRPAILNCTEASAIYGTPLDFAGQWIMLNCTQGCVVEDAHESWGALKEAFSPR
jgi:hypothetical protein